MFAELMQDKYWILILYLSFLICGAVCKNDSKSCPVWMHLIHDDSTWRCQCSIQPELTCYAESSIERLKESYCLSFDNTSSRQCLVTAPCQYSYYQQDYIRTLNSSVTPDEFNEAMCGPLKREGLFCSQCKPGYGIPVFSKGVDACVRCDSRYAWPLYLSLVLVPITVFYILVIIFNFSATRPPVTAYIFYCQLFSQLVSSYNVRFMRHFLEANVNHGFLYFTWTVCDVWSLDILRYLIPGFCVDERLSTKHALYLELITVFYPLLLILSTLVLIEMHASNFRVVVFLWKPFHKCFSLFRRTWDPRSSVINAFATFLVLSSFKLCFIVSTFFDLSHLSGEGISDSVLYIDPTIPWKELYKQPYFAPSLLLIVLFVLVPTFLLCIYPTKVCKIATQHICSASQRNGIFLFMDAFQGHYRNGTDGRYDCRSVSSVVFVLRVIVCWILSSRMKFDVHYISLCITSVLSMVSLFYALVRPYKKQYMNVIESVLYLTAALLLQLFLVKDDNLQATLEYIIVGIILTPSVIYFCIVVCKCFKVLRSVCKNQYFSGGSGDGSLTEAEPHRLTHPTQYSPLLQQ